MIGVILLVGLIATIIICSSATAQQVLFRQLFNKKIKHHDNN